MSQTIRYRPDIDGMRALAVLSVVLYHINPAWLPGGLLGVDIFFVISGYLITSIISREMAQRRFSFVQFYKRRAKRILPVFLFTLVFTTAAAAWLFMPEDFYRYLRSLNSSLFFSSNIHFAKNVDYFDMAATEKPLLHIWSLSVEEQFYFAFPLLLFWLCRRADHPRRRAVKLTLALIAASLLCGLLPYGKYEPYYLPQVRAYELLIGSLAAFASPNDPRWNTLFRHGRIICVLLLALLLAVLCVPAAVLAWGGGYVERLAVCLSAAGLIVLGSRKPLDVHRLLSLRPVVAVGLISYSLYLWHWMILALLRYVYMQPVLPLPVTAWAVAAMFAAAWLSYRLVETPARKAQHFADKTFGMVMLAYFVFAVGFNVASRKYKPYAEAREKQMVESVGNQSIALDPAACTTQQALGICTRGAPRKAPRLNLAVGDSHTEHYNAFFEKVGRHEGWTADIVSVGGCVYLHQSDLMPEVIQGEDWKKSCKQLRLYTDLSLDQYQNIIIAGRWHLHTDVKGFTEAFDRTLQYLISKGKTVYVLRDNPNTGISMWRRYFLEQKGIRIPDAEGPPNRMQLDTEEANRQIQALVHQYPQAHWVDLTGGIPKDYLVNNVPVYRDNNHLNPFGADYLADWFIRSGQRLLPPDPPPAGQPESRVIKNNPK